VRTLFVDEDFKAVSRPASHARGFIPFCLEHPNIRIVRHISILKNLLPAQSFSSTTRQRTGIDGSDCLLAIVPWIEETVSLTSHGMPARAFQLLVEGQDRESAEVWKLLKFAAATQEARIKQCKASETLPEPRRVPPEYYDDPWSLPMGFAQMVRDIVGRKSMVHYNGEVGELWDEDEFFSRRQNWTEDDWITEWQEEVWHTEIITTDRWPSICNKYSNLSEV